jgi:hypothetical protein
MLGRAVAWILAFVTGLLHAENNFNVNTSSSSFPCRPCTGREQHNAAVHEMKEEEDLGGEGVLTVKGIALMD